MGAGSNIIGIKIGAGTYIAVIIIGGGTNIEEEYTVLRYSTRKIFFNRRKLHWRPRRTVNGGNSRGRK